MSGASTRTLRQLILNKRKSFLSAMSDFAKDINVPGEDIRRKIEDYIWSITRLTKNLALYNHTLSEARDRLLPKLMSGEMEV